MKVGTVLENERWKIKVYSPPREHGPPHVHVSAKGEYAEVKVSLIDLSFIGRTKLSKKAVKEIIRYVYKNYEYLMDCWESLHGKKE